MQRTVIAIVDCRSTRKEDGRRDKANCILTKEELVPYKMMTTCSGSNNNIKNRQTNMMKTLWHRRRPCSSGCDRMFFTTTVKTNMILVIVVFYLAFAVTTGVYGQQDGQEKNSHDTGGVGAVCQEVDSVDDDGSCVNTNGLEPRDLPESYCTSTSGFGSSGETDTSSSSSFDLYRFGGSAQAYKPGASTSSVVCDPEVSKTTKYKASSWPFTRRTTSRDSAPTINVELTFWTCSPKSQKGSDGCICYPFQQGSRDDVRVEVWQTRPDGTYSTLNNGSDGSTADECRATVPVSMGPGTAAVTTTASFSTVAPGSPGVLGGLGPWNWESYPYGRPVIHILVNSPSYQTLLLDVPVLFVPKTLGQRDFSLKSLDWSGRGWSVRNPPDSEMPYNITSWNADVARNHIDIAIDLYLEKRQTENGGGNSKTSSTAADLFCPSSINSFTPTAFFVEPIAICRRYLLDFLSL